MRIREAVRAVLLTSENEILLMKFEEPASRRQFWITPGGARNTGEDVVACLIRELDEETGLRDVRVGPLIWKRRHTFEWNGNEVRQHEQFYLVKTGRFEPTMDGNPAMGEKSAFRGFRWWSIAEIKASSEIFAPRRIAELLDSIARSGPPERPLEVGV